MERGFKVYFFIENLERRVLGLGFFFAGSQAKEYSLVAKHENCRDDCRPHFCMAFFRVRNAESKIEIVGFRVQGLEFRV